MGTGDPTIICTICTNMDVLAEAYEFRCETCGRSVPNPVIALRAQLAAQAETIDNLRRDNENHKRAVLALTGENERLKADNTRLWAQCEKAMTKEGGEFVDLIRATAELAAARAESERLKAGIRQFARRLPVEIFATTNVHYWGRKLMERQEGLENAQRLLRELGLVAGGDD